MEDVRDGAPPVEVCTLERYKLGRRVEDLTLSNDDLMQGVLVHELIVVTGVRVCVHLDAIGPGLCSRCDRLLLLGERDSGFLGGHLRTFAWWQCQHGLHRLLLNGLERASAGLLIRPSALDWHQNSRLHRLQIEFNRTCAITTSCNLSFDILLALVVEFYAFAGNGRGTFFESRSQVDVFWNHTFVDQRHHAFIDCVFADRWIVRHVGRVRDGCRISERGQRSLLGTALCSVAFGSLDEGFLEDVGTFGYHQLALIDCSTVELVHAQDIRLHTHKRLLANGSTCSYDFWQFKIGQVLLGAAEVHGHGAD